MEELIFVFPNENHETEAKQFIEEFKKYNSQTNGTSNLDILFNEYSNWLQLIKDDTNREITSNGRVPSDTYFVKRVSDNTIVGMVNIRHILNDYLLEYGGHIGYCVRPTERNKGYATKILELSIDKCRELGIEKVLLVCDKGNIASAKTIQNNCGVLENEVIDDGEIIQRYWISTDLYKTKSI